MHVANPLRISRKNKKMKGAQGPIVSLTLHPTWIDKSYVLTTYMKAGKELLQDKSGNIQDTHAFLSSLIVLSGQIHVSQP